MLRNKYQDISELEESPKVPEGPRVQKENTLLYVGQNLRGIMGVPPTDMLIVECMVWCGSVV